MSSVCLYILLQILIKIWYTIVLYVNIFYYFIGGNMTRKKLANGLTQQQEDFCKYYVKSGIGYKAYLQAYPTAKSWARNSVDVAATKLLNNALISQRIQELNQNIESTLKTSVTLSQRKILEEIIKTYQETTANGASERTNSVNLLKLMAQISKLLENTQNNIQVNIQNNQTVGEVTDYLDL